MKKLPVFFLTLLFSLVVAALYGALHDQISYSISPEYFTRFKYEQFGFDPTWFGGHRPTIAIIGVLATWWVGLIAGLIHGFVGLFQPNASTMRFVVLRGILLTVGIAAATGLAGLAYGHFYLASHPPDWWFPENLADKRVFIAVGSMHNFSYLGSLIGLVASVFY